MSLMAKIQDVAAKLTPSEKKLVENLVASPREAALGSVSDLARVAGVHEATASRLVRKLGFKNYVSFRKAVRDEFLPTQEPATRIKKTLSISGSHRVLSVLIQQEMAALSQLGEFITQQQIEMAAKTLVGANRLFFFGRGNAESLSLMMAKRFRRFGLDVTQLSGDPRELPEQLLSLHAGDVVFILAFRRKPRNFDALIESAKEAGAQTIVISDVIGPMLSPTPDQLLAAPRSDMHDAFQTLTVPMTVCNAIVIETASMDKEKSLRELEKLGELIKRFE